MKRFLLLFLLLPLVACAGEQTRAAFTLRSPSTTAEVPVVDHAAEHAANLERAIELSIRAQEMRDDLEWKGRDHAKVVVAAAPTEPCVIHDLDTDTCGDAPQ